MNFGKVMESYLEKDCNTSWVIDALEQKHDGEYVYDTLSLVRVFHMWLHTGVNECCYAVSLHIVRDCEEGVESIDSKLTLSKIRDTYVGQCFRGDDNEQYPLIVALTGIMSHIDEEKDEQDVMLTNPIQFKARALVDWSKQGKTKAYYITGVRLEKRI